MDNLASILTAVSLVIVAITGLYTAQTARRSLRTSQITAARVEEVHTEVKTSNGITMAVLADRGEGRRIEAEVAADDRTPSEQHYVDKLHGPTDADGNPPPES